MAESDIDSPKLRRLAMELSALSESGLAYSTNEFDVDRFHRVGQLADELMDEIRDEPGPEYSKAVASVAGYTTPKLDVRGAVFNEAGEVLLVRELADRGRWTLPGGWCDVLETPSGAVEREVLEEAGLKVKATHLGAVFDRDLWAHWPPFDRHIYKMFFVCEPLGEIDPEYVSNETAGVGWFPIDDLPEMSISRVLPEQIELLHKHWKNPGAAYFD